jgi:hypothetical protein
MTFMLHLDTIYCKMANLFTAQSSESTQHRIEGAQVVGPDADFSFPFNVSLKHNWSYASTPPKSKIYLDAFIAVSCLLRLVDLIRHSRW